MTFKTAIDTRGDYSCFSHSFLTILYVFKLQCEIICLNADLTMLL